VWALAAHHPERCHGVANLCVPYLPGGLGPKEREPLIDRSIYPADTYPAGQWEYQLFYVENFEKARIEFEADIESTVKAMFRKGNPDAVGKPSRTAEVRRQGGWFGPLGKAPKLPLDTSVIREEELAAYVSSLTRNGFFGPNSWYMNHSRNAEFAKSAKHAGRISMPVLFLHGEYDVTCETVRSHLADPMRAACANLSEVVIQSGHWMAQEKPREVNAALASWLATKLADNWPTQLKQ
jgi:pimeloyl-ACP methyl ester carboxylesterase